MSLVVLVPGYGGRARFVERWRMAVAVRTLAARGGGRLVVSGHAGEAERLAALAPRDVEVSIESTARSTLENVVRSLPLLRDAAELAIASDRFHRRRVLRYLEALDSDLARRVVRPAYGWREGWWMDGAGAVRAALLRRRRRSTEGARPREHPML